MLSYITGEQFVAVTIQLGCGRGLSSGATPTDLQAGDVSGNPSLS